MKTKETVTKDPICGMSMNRDFAVHAERDGKTYYFCGEACLRRFNAGEALRK
jgi:P-type Cu+ transporter